MLGEIIIYNIIGSITRSHNKKQKELYRQKYPIMLSKDIPKIKVEPKPFSLYLEEAMKKINKL